ncbi:MAG: class II aldolase/adducin family protein [Pseudomonadota bacterium]
MAIQGTQKRKVSRKTASNTTQRKPAEKVDQLTEQQARKAVIETALKMSQTNLSPGRSGNVSMRWAGDMLITPSGLAYDALKPSDICLIDDTGSAAKKPGTARRARKPSSEWRFHMGAYRARSDRHAVVHTHSHFATVLACAHRPIPAFHYMVAVAGGTDIPLVPYAPFGTQELADHVAEGLRAHDACLMANHGLIAIGKDLASALELAAEVETLAAQYVAVLTLGKPVILGKSQMQDVLQRFAAYGQNAQPAD